MKNYSYILLRSFLGGASNSMNRLIVNDLPIYPFLFLRNLGIALLSLFFNDRSHLKEDILILRTDAKSLIQLIVSCLIHAIGTVLFFIALKELPVSIVSIYENGLYTLLTVFFAVALLKEKLKRFSSVYLIFCVLGLFLIVTKGVWSLPAISLLGISLLSLNALLSAINTTIEMYNLKKLSIFTITFFKSLLSAVVMMTFSLISDQSFNDFFELMTLWLLVFFVYSVVNSFAIKYLQLKSMKVLNSSKTAIFQLITPVFSVLFALMIFNESINWVQWSGILLILFSVYKLK